MAMEIVVLIPLVTGIVSIFISYGVSKRNAHKEATECGKSDGVVLTQIGAIQAGIDDIKGELKDQRKTNLGIVERLAIVEISTKQSHKRIDEHIDNHN